jgi:hypothetical protein
MPSPGPSSFVAVLLVFCAFSLAAVVVGGQRAMAGKPDSPSLAGAWTLVAADVLHPDGTQGRDYGASPHGLLLIDASGRYSLQIYKSERPRFAGGDKARGTPDEFQAAVLGSSSHFGRLEVDAAGKGLVFHIQGSSYPNWEGTEQVRRFELEGDELRYRVPPRPNGDVPLSIWRRIP